MNTLISSSNSNKNVVEKLESVLQKITVSDKNISLFIEDASGFSATQPVHGAEIAKILRKTVTERKIKLITASANNDYEVSFASDNQIKSQWKKIEVGATEEKPDDSFVGDKISPDLRELINTADQNEKVKIILQADNANNKELAKLLSDNQAKILRKRCRISMQWRLKFRFGQLIKFQKIPVRVIFH